MAYSAAGAAARAHCLLKRRPRCVYKPGSAEGVARELYSMPSSRKKKTRDQSPPLPPDINVYTLGDTWTDAEREFLGPFFAGINSAAEQVRYECVQSVRKYGIHVGPSHTGDGVFCGHGGVLPALTYVGYYKGTVENARKFKDDGYTIGLPPIRFPDGREVPAVLSGYNHRAEEGSAVMFNHSCQRFNAQYVLQDVHVKKDLEANWELQRLLQKKNAVIPDALFQAASEVLYTYPVVIAMTERDVAPGEEIRVTYNRQGGAKGGGGSSYFSTRRNAQKSAKKGYTVAKCMCEPGGCPLKRYFVQPPSKRADASPGPAAAASSSSVVAPAP